MFPRHDLGSVKVWRSGAAAEAADVSVTATSADPLEAITMYLDLKGSCS